MFLYPNFNSVNKEMRKGKYIEVQKRNSYSSFWRLSACSLFSVEESENVYFLFIYFLSEILRNSKAERKRRKRGSHKLDSRDRGQNLRFL